MDGVGLIMAAGLATVILIVYMINAMLKRVRASLQMSRRLDKFRPDRSENSGGVNALTTTNIIDRRRRGAMDSALGQALPTLTAMRRKFRQGGLPIGLSVYVGILVVFATFITFAPIEIVERPPALEEFLANRQQIEGPLSQEREAELRSEHSQASWAYVGVSALRPVSALLAGHFLIGTLGLGWWIERRKRKIVGAMPRLLDFINRSVTIGVPVDTALKDVLNECEEPLRSEVQRINYLVNIGTPLDRSLRAVADEIQIREFDFFSTAIIVQMEAGGNIGQAMANLADVIRQRHQMRMKVQALAAEGKMSAWFLGCMPFFLAFMFNLTNPDYLVPMYTTQQGWNMLYYAAGMMFVGAVIMRRMVRIKI